MRQGSPKHISRGSGGKWDASGIMLDESATEGPVDFAELFGNDRPVELEIGMGKGTFLLARAKARPEINFLGLEYARAYCRYCADRFRRAGLTNVHTSCVEAVHFFKVCPAERSLWRVHIYFPDPWPKRKHNRRRLIQPPFIEQVRKSLRIGGQLLVVTDHLDYFRQIQKVLNQAEGFADVPMPRMADESGELVGTNFERKYIAQGKAFYKAMRLRYY